MSTVTMTIDGRQVEVPADSYLLGAIRQLGIEVPALCHHAAVDPFAACRLCMVEIRKEGWDEDWTKMVASCAFPVENGLTVLTASPRVQRVRRVLFEMLLARCPESEVVRDLASSYGVSTTPFEKRAHPDRCILCGTCTRVCDKLGASAISTNQRGVAKRVGSPFGEKPVDCIGCLSCALNCPTGHITYSETDDARKIWNRSFPLQRCEGCGIAHVTREQVEFTMERHGLPVEHFSLCETCKQARTAQVFAGLSVPVEGAS